MTKYIILTTWFLFSLLNVKAQNLISSKVYDASTKEPILYVNIGIKNKNIGTVSNSNGEFKINVPDHNLDDSLTFSFVGYETLEVPIQNLLNNKPDSIFMYQKTQEFQEVVITSKGKWKSKKIGLSRNLPGVYGVVQSDTTADIAECAQQIDLGDELTKLSTFHIYLKTVNTDTANFRINIYHFNDSIPTDRAFEKEIFVRRHISNGWLEIDLEEYNIWLKDKIVVSIEFLPTDSQQDIISLTYGGIIICKGTSYNKTSSQGEWYKLDFGTYSIYVTTKKYKRKN